MPDFTITDFNIEPFKSLRNTPWEPSFTWVETRLDATKQINSYHENGKEHIYQTYQAIQYLETVGEWTGLSITEHIIKKTHAEIFPGEKWTGTWRLGGVIVGAHTPPSWTDVPWRMEELEEHSRILHLDTIHGLLNWYWAFETIHPFQDGNGRVGGAIVAAYSHLIEPDKGYLAVNQ